MVELLIASVIAASAGALLIGGLVAANRHAELRIERALLTQLLASRLALLEEPLGEQTPTGGTVSSPQGEITWTVEWTQIPDSPLAQTILTVRRGGHEAHVVTYRRLAE